MSESIIQRQIRYLKEYIEECENMIKNATYELEIYKKELEVLEAK